MVVTQASRWSPLPSNQWYQFDFRDINCIQNKECFETFDSPCALLAGNVYISYTQTLHMKEKYHQVRKYGFFLLFTYKLNDAIYLKNYTKRR